ncbi:MAG TPA: hypothetical protein VFV33_14485, partial [Gemmatimonadaceae bacterium]|nr:hypothetical protein [Gemmatimonadaceae bacterium]
MTAMLPAHDIRPARMPLRVHSPRVPRRARRVLAALATAATAVAIARALPDRPLMAQELSGRAARDA